MKLNINDTFTAHFAAYNQTELHKVTGFTEYDNGETGVQTVRFIKSRNDWAKTPQAWVTLEEMARRPEMYKNV